MKGEVPARRQMTLYYSSLPGKRDRGKRERETEREDSVLLT